MTASSFFLNLETKGEYLIILSSKIHSDMVFWKYEFEYRIILPVGNNVDFLGYGPDFAAGVSQNKGNHVLWICTENRNGILLEVPILFRHGVFAYVYISKL